MNGSTQEQLSLSLLLSEYPSRKRQPGWCGKVSAEMMEEDNQIFHPLDLRGRIFNLIYLKLSNLTLKISQHFTSACKSS